MAKEARSLTAALNRTPEIEAFISADTKRKPKVIEETTAQTSEAEKPQNSDSHAKAKPASISGDQQPRAEGKRTTKLKPKPKMAAENNLLLQPRVPISTRVQVTTAKSLLKASYERKLAGLSPWSQQDIIEQAVLEWLVKHS
jgi:hypothetical protein